MLGYLRSNNMSELTDDLDIQISDIYYMLLYIYFLR